MAQVVVGGADTSNAATTAGGVTAGGSSFLELEGEVGVTLSTLSSLAGIANHALENNPASPNVPTRYNQNPQYVIVYARDDTGKWWYNPTVFRPDTVKSIHAETFAWKAKAFDPREWSGNIQEIAMFTWYSPCTTVHGRHDAYQSCKDTVVKKVQAYLAKQGIGFTVLQAEWYQNGHFFDGTNLVGGRAVTAERNAYKADATLKLAESGKMFRLVTVDWSDGGCTAFKLN